MESLFWWTRILFLLCPEKGMFHWEGWRESHLKWNTTVHVSYQLKFIICNFLIKRMKKTLEVSEDKNFSENEQRTVFKYEMWKMNFYLVMLCQCPIKAHTMPHTVQLLKHGMYIVQLHCPTCTCINTQTISPVMELDTIILLQLMVTRILFIYYIISYEWLTKSDKHIVGVQFFLSKKWLQIVYARLSSFKRNISFSVRIKITLTTSPDIHRPSILFPVNHFWGHEMWRSYSTYNELEMTKKKLLRTIHVYIPTTVL